MHAMFYLSFTNRAWNELFMKNKTALLFIVPLTVLSSFGANPGYPRPMLFRENFPKLIPEYGHIDMMVSDLHTDKRKFCDIEFKKQNPDALMLVQFNNEPTGIWGTWEMLPKQKLDDLGWLQPEIRNSNPLLDLFNHGIYPMMDFPGHWVYEAGATVLSEIPAGEQSVTFKVSDMTPFRPVNHRLSLNVAKAIPEVENALSKELVLYSRNPDGSPDWLNAELGSITAIDEKEKTVTVRRWKKAEPSPSNVSRDWKAFPPGVYAAPSAVPVTYENAGTIRAFPPQLREQMKSASVMKPFLPNLTKNCPVDPRTGLTAVETMAKHYIEMKRTVYPNADGFVFDVSCGTFWPSHRVSDRVDCDNDGKIDNFQFDGVLIWPLGIFDFCTLLREGKPGVFQGLGKDFLLISDSNFNEDQRFFDVMNGGEYEHSFTLFFPPWNTMYSSSLDRYLLWDRIGRKPNITFIHNKYADEVYHGGDVKDLKRPATLAHYRLDMATACMGSGYVGKMVLRALDNKKPEVVNYPGLKEERKQYGGSLPTVYDEYHAGRNEYGWLGLPKGDAFRIQTGWGEPLYTFDRNSKLPAVSKIRKPWEIAASVRTENGFALEVKQVGLWRETKDDFTAVVTLPLPGVSFEKDCEYVLTFKIKGSAVYEAYGPQYHNIPKNLRMRLNSTAGTQHTGSGALEKLDSNVAQLMGDKKTDDRYHQEILVFAEERNVTLTLIAPASGPAGLDFDVTDEKGSYEISGLTLRKGCADVLAREFEHGLVLANGSAFSDAVIDVPALFPGAQFKRILGKQDPIHNSGEPAETVTLQASDGIFLERIK